MTVPRTIRWILQGVFAFTIFVAAIYLFIFAVNSIYGRQAEHLLRDVGTLQVGSSNTEDVLRIMSRYGGGPSEGYASFCKSADAVYSASVGNRTLNRVGEKVPVLRLFGFRLWAAGVMVLLERGRVCFVSSELVMNDSIGKWTWDFDTSALPAGTIEFPNVEHPGYSVYTQDLRDRRILRTEVTSEATDGERQHAFAFDLSCLTRIGGCKQRCELAPLVWQELYRESEGANWALPKEETSDPLCAFAESKH